jgi:molecular chaperone GrpE
MAKEKNSPDKTTECEVSPGPEEVALEVPSGAGEREATLEAEAKAAQDRFLRLAAEFENYKKRVQRDQDEYTKYAHERLLKDLLPVLDNLQRALQHTQSEGNTNGVVHGVELTCKQYLEVLSRFGVRPIPSVGLPFDPAVHQAVATVEAKGQKPNTVVEEYEKGYFLYDRVLRPAMVTVAASSPEECRDAPVKSTP